MFYELLCYSKNNICLKKKGMVNPLVERATSDLLIGPDWAKNAEICDILIHDPGQVKDVVKGIKKRIGSKNQKAQILALTLLETLMNNCGDFVHMHVAERGVLQKMVKIAKRKRNYYVREKILMLIDIWQEAFGGPGARYPQYHAAFHSLSRSGAVFPRRSDPRAPIFAPPQSQFPSSYAPNLREPGHQQERAEVSEDSDFPTLSLSEIQNARGLVDILAEMLNGLEPGNKEGLRQEAIVDLVQQCRTYKQRVVHLVNSTMDESLLRQGLGLNDDLQRLLAKHEAIASGTSSEVEKSNPVMALIELDDPKQPDEKNLSSNPANQSPLDLLLPTADDLLTPSTKIDPGMDLLSGGDNGSPTENSLAIVPVGEQQANSPVSQQNNNALSVMLAQNDASANSLDPKSMYQAGQAFPSTPQYQYEQNMQSPHAAIYSDGSNIGSPQYQQQQHEHLVNGTQGGSYLPPPPWEAQTMENQQMAYPHYPQAMQITQQMHSGVDSYSVGNNQAVVMYVQPMTSSQLGAVHNQPIQSNHQLVGMHQSFQGSTMMAMVPHGANMYNQSMQSNMQLQDHYGAQSQYLEQRMYGLTVGGDTAANNSPYQVPTSSYLPPMKPSRPQDNLFGDLVNMAKSKPKNSSVGTPGSM